MGTRGKPREILKALDTAWEQTGCIEDGSGVFAEKKFIVLSLKPRPTLRELTKLNPFSTYG